MTQSLTILTRNLMFYKINYVIQICPRFVPHLFHIFAKFFLDLSKICPRFVPNFPQIFPTFSQIFPRFAPDFLQIFPDLSQICPRFFFLSYIYSIDTFQDFLIKLDIKPLIHLLEISIFSLNNLILRLTKIMNRADKNRAHF